MTQVCSFIYKFSFSIDVNTSKLKSNMIFEQDLTLRIYDAVLWSCMIMHSLFQDKFTMGHLL